jgi:hypothetical protein
VHSRESQSIRSGCRGWAPAAKSPEFRQFCLQTAVNHQNAVSVGFCGEIGYRYQIIALVGPANMAGAVNLWPQGVSRKALLAFTPPRHRNEE